MFATPRKATPRKKPGHVQAAQDSAAKSSNVLSPRFTSNTKFYQPSAHERACNSPAEPMYTFSTVSYHDPQVIHAHTSIRAPLLPIPTKTTPVRSALVLGTSHSGIRPLGRDVLPIDVYELAPPLHRAVQQNDLEAVRQLVSDPGTKINHQDRYGCTALHYACMTKQPSLPIIRLLLSMGADPRILNDAGNVPLQELRGLESTDECAELLYILISAGSPVDVAFRSQAFEGSTAFIDERGDASEGGLTGSTAPSISFAFYRASDLAKYSLTSHGNFLLTEVCALTPPRPDLVALILERTRMNSFQAARAVVLGGDITDGDTALHVSFRRYVRDRLALVPDTMQPLPLRTGVEYKLLEDAENQDRRTYSAWQLVVGPYQRHHSIPQYWLEWFGSHTNAPGPVRKSPGIALLTKHSESALREYLLRFDSIVEKRMQQRALVIMLLIFQGAVAFGESPVTALLAKNCSGETVYDLCESEGDIELLDVLVKLWEEWCRMLGNTIVKSIGMSCDAAVAKWMASARLTPDSCSSPAVLRRIKRLSPAWVYSQADLSTRLSKEVLAFVLPQSISSEMAQQPEQLTKNAITSPGRTRLNSTSPWGNSWANKAEILTAQAEVDRKHSDSVHRRSNPNAARIQSPRAPTRSPTMMPRGLDVSKVPSRRVAEYCCCGKHEADMRKYRSWTDCECMECEIRIGINRTTKRNGQE